MTYNIIDFGAVGDSVTNCTKALQAAIDTCSKTGGRVLVPAGVYYSGSLRLRSNIDLHLESGATLISSLSESDIIDFAKDFDDDNKDTGWEGGCFLFARNEKNITISGSGTIDGQGRNVFFDENNDSGHFECPLSVKSFRPRMSFLENIENITIKDVTFFDSSFWTIHLAGCKNVLIDSVRILNNERGPNNDGIDPDCCQDVIIKDCIIKGGDDSVVIKTTAPMASKYGESKNILISNCIMKSRSCALKIGTETHSDIHHVILSDCILDGCNRGIGIWSRDGGNIHDISIHHISGNTRRFADCNTDKQYVSTWWGKGEPIFISSTRRNEYSKIPGHIYSIYIDHCNMNIESPIIIAGEEYSRISDIDMSDVNLLFIKQSSFYPEYIDERPSKRGIYKKTIPIIYSRCVDDISISGKFEIDESLRTHITYHISEESCNNFIVHNSNT